MKRAWLVQAARLLLVLSFFALPAGAAQAQTAAETTPGALMQQFSNSVQALAARVSPSVVQILVTRYGQREETGATNLTVGRQQAIGSGVIVDPNGYIMTNAHVVEGAQSITVRLTPEGQQTIPSTLAQFYTPAQNATLVGAFTAADLALIKIDTAHLPTLPFADYRKLQQGEVVFTFGSPQGLQNSVGMGIVSSIARQPDPDNPWIYIQTDAPINPGNSGGPLVNTKGEIVGLNTFIVSESGGSEGIGFAIPSVLVQWVFNQLKKYGHVHRPVMGISVQAITPLLASALKLPRSSGVVVSDVLPGSPADVEGVKLNDVLLSMDGVPVSNVAAMLGATIRHGSGRIMRLQVLRGGEQLSLSVTPVEQPDEPDRFAAVADSAKSAIPSLGILGVTVNRETEHVAGSLRIASGVLVLARLDDPGAVNPGLLAGDVIHGVNGNPVATIEALRAALTELHPGDPAAVQIERAGKLYYVPFRME